MPFDQENRERIQVVEKSFGPSGKPLLTEGRILVGEGKLLKMGRRGPQSKMFFLFNDILVYGSIVIPRRLYKSQQIIPLSELEVVDQEDGVGMVNQWLLKTRRKSFMVAAVSMMEKEAWMDHIDRCICRLHLDEEKKNDFAAAWIPDRASAICMRCTERFGITNRRHHCRRCGFIVCDSCSKGRAVLENISSKPVRICRLCLATMEADRQNKDKSAWSKNHWKKDSVEDKMRTFHDEVSSNEECEEQDEGCASNQLVSEQDSAWSPYCYFNPDHAKPHN